MLTLIIIKKIRKRQTHGVSSITLHTLAIVLNTSVVFAIGKFLFCVQRKMLDYLSSNCRDSFRNNKLFLFTSDTNFVVPSLNVFSMGVASA